MYYRIKTTLLNKYDVELNDNYEFKAEDSVWNIRTIKYESKVNLNFEGFILNNKSKVYDLYHCHHINYYYGIIISNKLRSILKHFKLPNHDFIDIDIKKGNRVLTDFCILLLNETAAQYIDFDNSRFYKRLNPFDPPKLVEGLKYEEYKEALLEVNLTNKHSGIFAHKLCFNEKLEYDILTIFNISNGLLISEKLKKAIEEQSISGITFEPLNEER